MIPSRLDQVLSQKTRSDVPKAMMGPRFGSGQPGSEGGAFRSSLSSAAAGAPEEQPDSRGTWSLPQPAAPTGLRGREPPPLAARSPRASCGLSGAPACSPAPGSAPTALHLRAFPPLPSPQELGAWLLSRTGTEWAPHTGTGPRGPQALSDERRLPPGSQGGGPAGVKKEANRGSSKKGGGREHFRSTSAWNAAEALSERQP